MPNSRFAGISIECPASDLYFELSVNEALGKIYEKPVGRLLLQEIGLAAPGSRPNGYNVLIYPPNKREFTQAGMAHPIFGNMVQDGSPCDGAMTPRGAGDNAASAESTADSENGQGSSSRVRWNSSITTLKMTGDTVPAFICLAHELIHALHHLKGTKKSKVISIEHAQGGAMTISEEEFYTAGVRGFEDEEISENKIRAEWKELKIKQRADYP